MKKLIFKKGVDVIYIPFLLSTFDPWQKQIHKEIAKIKRNYKFRKDVKIGYQIIDDQAAIILSIQTKHKAPVAIN